MVSRLPFVTTSSCLTSPKFVKMLNGPEGKLHQMNPCIKCLLMSLNKVNGACKVKAVRHNLDCKVRKVCILLDLSH